MSNAADGRLVDASVLSGLRVALLQSKHSPAEPLPLLRLHAQDALQWLVNNSMSGGKDNKATAGKDRQPTPASDGRMPCTDDMVLMAAGRLVTTVRRFGGVVDTALAEKIAAHASRCVPERVVTAVMWVVPITCAVHLVFDCGIRTGRLPSYLSTLIRAVLAHKRSKVSVQCSTRKSRE